MERRVVVTGIGLVTPLGIGRDETWTALARGQERHRADHAVRRHRLRHQVRGRGEGLGADALDREARGQDLRPLPAVRRRGVAAGQGRRRARASTTANAERVGVYIGAGLGGVRTIEKTHTALLEKGPRHGISPYFVPDDHRQHGARAWCRSASAARGRTSRTCRPARRARTRSARRMRAIQRGDADAMIAGGCEATITPLGVGGFNAMRALSTRNDEPTQASPAVRQGPRRLRHRRGRGRPRPRGARARPRSAARSIYAELVGYGALVGRAPHGAAARGGEGAQRCMQDGARATRKLDPERDRLHQRARHLDQAGRHHRDHGGQGGVRRPRARSWRCRRPSR